MGMTVAAERTFPDHHAYTRADVDSLRRWAAGVEADVILTTQKDMVKLRMPDLAGKRLYAVRIGIRFLDGEDGIRAKLRAVVGEPTGVPA